MNIPGTHNSGAGAYGLLYWYSGAAAPSCSVRNQDKSITQQLNLGIRYFDLDLDYVESGSSDWWEPGLVLVHCHQTFGCAYSRSLEKAMVEIEDFLGQNRDEIVVIRFKDHPEHSRDNIRQHLGEALKHLQSSSKVQINPNPNPRIGDAIRSNKRLLIFVNGGFYRSGYGFNPLQQVESYTGSGATSGCYSVQDVVDTLMADKYRVGDDRFPLQVTHATK